MVYTKRFEVGRKYWSTSLYGDEEYMIKIVDRTDKTISYVYGDNTSDDKSVQTVEIETQNSTVYGKDLKEIESIKTEAIEAWRYHSPYAKPGEYNYAYYFAFDSDRLYTPEEWDAEKSGWSIRCDLHNYVTLEYEGKCVLCYDNYGMFMEDIIEKIEHRTKRKFDKIKIIGRKEDFNGLRFRTGFKSNWL